MLARRHVADRQRSCCLFVGQAGCEKLQYFPLARCADDAQSQVVVFLSASGLSRR